MYLPATHDARARAVTASIVIGVPGAAAGIFIATAQSRATAAAVCAIAALAVTAVTAVVDRRAGVANPLLHTHRWEVQYNDDDRCTKVGCTAYRYGLQGSVVSTKTEYYRS